MWQRIRVITIKEFRQALREPLMRLVLFVPPVLQLILFGFAVNLDISRAQVAWMDLDQTSASTDLRAAFDASPTFVVSRVIANEQEVKEVLDRGEVMAVVRVLPGFGKEVKRGQTT
ncbi:MAG TPA: ABC transporter permease, partial [Terriglobia bacterium]|nr:ABC transporter permease [Terriglobia bacterium]